MPKHTHNHVNPPRSDAAVMRELADTGNRMYHQPLNPDQQRRIGQTSLTDVDSSGLGWPEAGLNPAYPRTPAPLEDPRDLAENGEF